MIHRPLTPEEQTLAEALFKKYDGFIYKLILSYMDPELTFDAEDIAQEIGRMICEQIDDFKVTKTPKALIRTMTIRHVASYQKKLRQQQHEPLDEDYPAKEPPVKISDYFTSKTTPFEKFILDRVYTKGDTIEEVANDIGVPASRLRQRFKRARDHLRDSIDEKENF